MFVVFRSTRGYEMYLRITVHAATWCHGFMDKATLTSNVYIVFSQNK